MLAAMPTRQFNIRLDEDEYDMLVTIRDVLRHKNMTTTVREVVRQGTASIIKSKSFRWLYDRAREMWAADLDALIAQQAADKNQEAEPGKVEEGADG